MKEKNSFLDRFGFLTLIFYFLLISVAVGAIVGGLFFGLPIYFLGLKVGLIIGSSIISFLALCFLLSQFKS